MPQLTTVITPLPTTTHPHPARPRPRPRSGADRMIRAAAASAVVALAAVAAAVSYAHMRVLADRHGETGWQGHAFPLSVDGIEIVASLVLLADRRSGRPPGPLVWAALAAGTVASMAANVAVGPADPIGRVIAGWPAFALLMAIKLLTGLIEHPTQPPPTTTSRVRPAARPRPATTTTPPVRAARTDRNRPDRGPSPQPMSADIADLIPAARAIQAAVTRDGGRLTRDVLRHRLRTDGIAVSNRRLSLVLHALAADPDDTDGGPPPTPTT